VRAEYDVRAEDARTRAPAGAGARSEPAAPSPEAAAPSTWIATVFLAALTLASAMGFSRVFADSRWVGPVVVTALATHGFCALLRRRRLVDPLPILVGLAFVALLSVYVVLPHSLTFFLPLGRSWTTVHQQLLAGRTQIRNLTTPIPASPALTLLAVWAVGIAAVLADWLTFRVQAPLQGTAPAFAVFIASCALGSPRNRPWLVGLEVAALSAFLLAHRITIGGKEVPELGRPGRPAGTPPGVAVGVGAAAIAVVAAVAVTPLLPNTEGTGVLGWKTLNHGSGNRVTPSPFDDLRTRLIAEAPTEVMTVRSPVASYWRLTSLDTFTGQVWESTNSYHDVSSRLPGTPSAPGTTTVQESFHIEALDSIWLPTAFDPESVRARQPVTWDPRSGSLLSSKPTANGENYQVTSAEELAKLDPNALSSVPPVQPTAIAADLRLPAQIPANVVRLAKTLTASQPTEYAKAYALEQFFHQPEFRYSLNPASDDSTSALETFLFRTRQGYCQQFAGAYAVLARLAGLPTRIAIGFQPGTLEADGLYHVSNTDAHAWPEVYFPTIGWVPFEPTPGRQVPGGASYTGYTSSQTVPAPPPTTATTPSNPAVNGAGAAPTTTLPASATPPTAGTATGGSSLVPLGIAAASLAAGAGAWIAALAVWRRRRWRRRRTAAGLASGVRQPGVSRFPPTQAGAVVLVAWDETVEYLARWDVRRAPDETFNEFASRAQDQLGDLLNSTSDGRRLTPVDEWQGGITAMREDAPSGRLVTSGGRTRLPSRGELGDLAELAERAAYGNRNLEPPGAEQAWDLAERLGRQLHDVMPLRRRLAVLIRPRYSRALDVDPVPAAFAVPAGVEEPEPEMAAPR
jgi:transglutaminase-like putative cysteine protease